LQSGSGSQKGRYHLVEEVALPMNQQGRGRAWIAFDMRAPKQRVFIREVLFDAGSAENPSQFVLDVAQELADLAQQNPRFPAVIETFSVKSTYYIVQQNSIGESLASLMNRQGGALPEREIAEYGRQVCEMLTLLLDRPVPKVHGAISPDTIIIDQTNRQASLLYMPLFPPKSLAKDTAQSAYVAPEQARGMIQPASDIYALAATMHHAVTGFDPRERLANFYPPVRRLNPTISQSMETILANGLRLSVAQRTFPPGKMQQELNELIQSIPDTVYTPPLTAIKASAIGSVQKWQRNLVIAVTGALFVILISLLILPQFLNQPKPVPSQQAIFQQNFNQQLATELRSYTQKGIGVSEGRLTFDTYPGRADVALKKQAATAIQQNNMSVAVNALNQAVNNDLTDGEVQIYNENIHILQNKSPYITLAIGLSIDGSDAYLGTAREELEAVFLAQHETNSKNTLPHGLKLRIVIVNSGSNNADVATVAQFVADRVVKAGNPDHLVGLVGWDSSTRTINARDILAGAHLPIVAETASSVTLSGSSPYFFRVNPSDAIQGQAIGKLLTDTLNVRHMLILRDTTDAYSVSLANAVAGRVQSAGGVLTKGTFTINQTTVDQYQQMVQNLLQSDPTADTVFLAGFNTDGIRLAHAIGNLARANPANLELVRFRVVGGDALDSVLLLGIGNNQDAEIARNFPDDMQRMLFSTFADFNEWNFQNIPHDQQPTFFGDWVSTYQSSAMGTNAPTPQYNGLMIYDAVNVYVHAASLVKESPITGDELRAALVSLGKGGVPYYQGISGRIAFDSRGDPIDKALVILAVQPGKNGNEIAIKAIAGTFH
jgi:ABC-type branched-subunit amino acid transport system substrate-binding protein